MNADDLMNSSQEISLPRQSDVDYFKENGFWIGPKLFSSEQLERIRESYYEVLRGHYETGIAPIKRSHLPSEISEGVVKITNCVWANSTLSRVILNQTIGEFAARLLGVDTIRYWRDHLWYKPPGSGNLGIVGWHQDYYYWQCAEPANLITAWIALDDVSLSNGCLEMIPGSHRHGLFYEGGLYAQEPEPAEERIVKSTQHLSEAVPCELQAGQVSFHHCLTLHGSRPNLGDRPRLSLSVHMFPDGTRYFSRRSVKPFSNEELLSGSDGDLFLGPHFPIIYRSRQNSNPWT